MRDKTTQSLILHEDVIEIFDILTRFGLIDSRSHGINEAIEYYLSIFNKPETLKIETDEFIDLIRNNFKKQFTLNGMKNEEHNKKSN